MRMLLLGVALFGLSACAGNADNLYQNSTASDHNCWLVDKIFGEKQQMQCALTQERAVWKRDFPMGLQAFDQFSDLVMTALDRKEHAAMTEEQYAQHLALYRNALYQFYVRNKDSQRAAQIQQDENTRQAVATTGQVFGDILGGLLEGAAIAAQAQAQAQATAPTTVYVQQRPAPQQHTTCRQVFNTVQCDTTSY
jgi:hypothetical protein